MTVGQTDMEQSEDKKGSSPANDSLTPKPPRWVENILWYTQNWRRYWPLLLVGLLCVIGYLILTKNDFFFANSETSPRTFKFLDFEDAQLRRMVEESTGWNFDMSDAATYWISFDHTGKLRPAHQPGYYLFDGGTVLVLVNGAKCCEITQMVLTPYSHGLGNPKHVLEREIRRELEVMLKCDPQSVVNCIRGCMGNDD